MRGKVAVRDGKFVGTIGRGQILKREPDALLDKHADDYVLAIAREQPVAGNHRDDAKSAD